MAKQLVFDLPRRASLTRGDFFVSDANAAAVAMIDAPDGWPNGRLIVAGPEGAGKSHLANVWHLTTDAPIVLAEDLDGQDIAALGACSHLIVEDIDKLSETGETAAFHLLNLMAENRGRLLMTSRIPPAALKTALRDLLSRLQASGVATLDQPDDTLLAQLLLKLFADRQISPEPALIPWLVARLERSFAAAEAAVATLDRAALEGRQNVTRALARKALDL